MNDELKVLLTLAAKACGHEIYGFCVGPNDTIHYADIGPDNVIKWAPHLDNATNRKLEVDLGICVEFAGNYVAAYAGSRCAPQFTERLDKNAEQAVCMAVLRAAAEIGRNIK